MEYWDGKGWKDCNTLNGQTNKQSHIESLFNALVSCILGSFVWLYLIQPMGYYFEWDFNNLLIVQVIIINTIYTLIHYIKFYIIRRWFNRRDHHE